MESNKKNSLLKLLTVSTFVLMVGVNALANMLPINGLTTGAVSDSYPNLFAPAALTFSIWGLIYILLALHTLYQFGLFQGKEKNSNDIQLQKIAILFSASSLLNAAWIFSWHYKIISLSLIFIIFLFLCLIAIVSIINAQNLSFRGKIFLRLPFSIYFGWITVATIANGIVFLVSIGWTGFGLSESVWTIIMLTAGAAICITTTIHFRDIAYGLVFVWAYAGILIKHTTTSGFSSQYPTVIITVILCIVLIAGTVLYVFFDRKPKTVNI